MLFRRSISVVLFFLFLPACDRGQPVHVPKGAVQASKKAPGGDWLVLAKDALVIKHRYRVGTVPGWKAEFWLWGSRFPRNQAIDINIRLTPDEDLALKVLPPTLINLRVSRLGEDSEVCKYQPVIDWQECTKMAARAESTYEDGQYLNQTCFPPKFPCWEGTAAFQSPKKLPFEIGDYLLQAEIAVGNAPKIEIRKVEMRMYEGFEPPAAVPYSGNRH